MAAATALTKLCLPQELVDLIVYHIVPDSGGLSPSSKKDLSALSRAAKLFLGACQKALFKTVVLQPNKFALDGQDYKGRDTTFLFGELIARSPHLANLVKTLVYRLSFYASDRTDNKSNIVSALAKLTNVTELRFEGSEGSDYSSRRMGYLERDIREIRILSERHRFSPTNIDFELLRIMQSETVKILKMRNVRISLREMAKIRSIETLELDNCSLVESGDWDDDVRKGAPTTSTPHNLNHFAYNGRYACNSNTSVLDPNPKSSIYSGYFKVKWNELESLSLPIEYRYFRRSTFPRIIMSSTRKLKVLNMHTMKPFAYGATNKAVTLPHECPMLHLHSDSFTTLTKISFRIGFEVVWPHEIIKDPYHGLLLDGIIQNLVNLESLSIQVLIGGKWWRLMRPGLLGPQWGELDRFLAPKGRNRPFERLRQVELRVGNDGICDREDGRHHREGFQNMLDTNFDGLKELEQEGQIGLLLQIVHRRNQACWRLNEGEDVGEYTDGGDEDDS